MKNDVKLNLNKILDRETIESIHDQIYPYLEQQEGETCLGWLADDLSITINDLIWESEAKATLSLINGREFTTTEMACLMASAGLHFISDRPGETKEIFLDQIMKNQALHDAVVRMIANDMLDHPEKQDIYIAD